jgi:hypothetical protein
MSQKKRKPKKEIVVKTDKTFVEALTIIAKNRVIKPKKKIKRKK